MEEFKQSTERNEEIEIDLSRLWKELKKKIVFIILVGVIGAVIALLATTLLMTKQYSSTAKIYLRPNVTEAGTVDYNTLTANSKMVNNYISMIQGDTVLEKVETKLGLEERGEDFVKNSLSVSNVSDSEIILVTSKTDDPELSRDIVNTTVNEFFEYTKDKLDIKNLVILDQPKAEETPVSPSLKTNVAIGALLGVMVSGGIVVLRFLLDKRLHTKDDVESYLGIPVLAEIPYFED